MIIRLLGIYTDVLFAEDYGFSSRLGRIRRYKQCNGDCMYSIKQLFH